MDARKARKAIREKVQVGAKVCKQTFKNAMHSLNSRSLQAPKLAKQNVPKGNL